MVPVAPVRKIVFFIVLFGFVVYLHTFAAAKIVFFYEIRKTKCIFLKISFLCTLPISLGLKTKEGIIVRALWAR